MAIKRSQQIDADKPGFYHLISRCVRRAFLCGFDDETGQSYEHRRSWIEERILALADIFAVEIYAYAVMSNHYHLVVQVDPQAPQDWSDAKVASRWLKLFPGPCNQSPNGQQTASQREAILSDPQRLVTYRERLGSLSWLMKCINEPLAKKSNREDCMKGHFWELRFSSQALLDEAAVITCMAYVDLNPIRAGLTQTLEDSKHTSVQTRTKAMTPAALHQAVDAVAGEVKHQTLSLTIRDYLELVEWTGQNITHPNKARIPAHITPLFQRLSLNQANWLGQIKHYQIAYHRVIGKPSLIHAYTERIQQRWVKGIPAIKKLYRSAT